MGQVYEDFQRELSLTAEKYKNRAEDELKHLFLLALEREELVSIGYRESLITWRLGKMPVSDEVREILRHALTWAWKDEEMHTIYIRGAILKLGTMLLRTQAFAVQAAGALGGWAASVRQHAGWRDAPVSRLLASMIAFAGTITGKVPRHIRQYLDCGPFRNFCLFNVDAEKTAWLCWHRLADLVAKFPGAPPEMRADFLRIEADELRHQQIFQIIADSLDENDQLVTGVTPNSLAEKIAAVGEFFLPRSLRISWSRRNPIGSCGQVYVSQADAQDQKNSAFHKFLENCGLREELAARTTTSGKPLNEIRVAIKPTFMLGYHKRDLSPLTDPQLLHELAAYLMDQGCKDVAVLEGPNIYDKFYQNRSVHEVAEYFSISSPHYRMVDVSAEQVPHSYARGLGQYMVSRTWKEADFRISFGKMRSHPIELALLTIGNLEGIGSRCEEFIFVERQAHRETAVMTLISDFPPHFAILDAFERVPDGLLGVMGCPSPKRLLRFYGGRDALAVDIVAGRHLGMKNPHQSSILQAACQWFGTSGKIEVIGIDQPVRNWRSPYHNEFSTFLCFLAYPVYVLGSGRGSLFVPEMDHAAFPPVVPETRPLRWGRQSLQILLGLKHRHDSDSTATGK